ncbi:MAG: class I SAM-dependent methyltransferase [Nitrospinaceae bacterium]
MNDPDSNPFLWIPCETCGSDRFIPVCEWNGVSQVVRCDVCGLQFVNPMPDQEYLNEMYQRDSQPGESGIPYFLNYTQERRDRAHSYNKLYVSRLKRMEKYCPEKGNLLEIGCAGGFFLKAAEKRGWNPHGIEIVPEFVRFAREELLLPNVREIPLEDKSYDGHFFDAVVLWDLIEHLRHPLHYLREINRILRPGGLLVLWTPNVRNAALLKEKWYGYKPHHHLYFFSLDSLSQMFGLSGYRILYKNTNKAKKGFFGGPKGVPYRKPSVPPAKFAKLLRGAKRDFKNFINPVNYISPVLDWAGYGFNLYVIVQKSCEGVPTGGESKADGPDAPPSLQDGRGFSIKNHPSHE